MTSRKWIVPIALVVLILAAGWFAFRSGFLGGPSRATVDRLVADTYNIHLWQNQLSDLTVQHGKPAYDRLSKTYRVQVSATFRNRFLWSDGRLAQQDGDIYIGKSFGEWGVVRPVLNAVRFPGR